MNTKKAVLLIFNFWLAASAFAQSPFVVAYNETTSVLVPLFRVVYAEIGMVPRFELVSSERGVSETNLGHYDADISRVAESLAGYDNLVPTNEAIKTTEIYAYVRKGSALTISRGEDLLRVSLGLVRGSKFIEDYVRRLGVDAYAANTSDSFYQMLDAGRFDVALVTSTQLLANADQLAKAERVGPVLASSQSFHILNKKHADLIPKLDAVLKAMRADGRLVRLLSTATRP